MGYVSLVQTSLTTGCQDPECLHKLNGIISPVCQWNK